MRVLISMLVVLVLSSCGEYSRVLKKGTPDEKLTAAKKYYNKGDYARAEPLFADLMNLYFGKSEREEIYFFYSYTHYGLKNYLTAGYHFENFGKSYPYSARKEEAMYMGAVCVYHQSLDYELDQQDTKDAIRKMQAFINQYPNSGYVEDCNQRMDELRKRLLKKAYEGAKLYYSLEEYKAAIVACNNALSDYPDMIHRDELHYLVVQSSYIYASNSLEQLQEERYDKVLEYVRAYQREYGAGNAYNDRINKIRNQTVSALQDLQAEEAKPNEL